MKIFKQEKQETKHHYGDCIIKVEKVIDSCTTWSHTLTARKLLWLLRNRVPEDIEHDVYMKMFYRLNDKRTQILKDYEA